MKKITASVIRSSIQILEAKPNFLSFTVMFCFAFFCVIYWSLTVNPGNCSGDGDCVKYFAMAHSFAENKYIPIDYPFNFRIMAPWLANFFAQHLTKGITEGFIWLNSISVLLFTFFWFAIVRKLELRNIEFLVVLLWFFIHPLGFEAYWVTPVAADSLQCALFSFVSFLFIYEKRIALWATILVAFLAKESFCFIALITSIAELSYVIAMRNKINKAALLSSFMVIPSLFFYQIIHQTMQIHLFPKAQTWDVSIIGAVSYWGNLAWHEPKRFIVWIGAFFSATGLFSIFLLNKRSIFQNPIQIRQAVYFALGGIGFVLLGLLAGSDMSRIIFNGNLFIISALLFAFIKQRIFIYQLLTVFLVSVMLAKNYIKFLSSNIEYDYYRHEQRIAPIVFFIIINLLVIFFLHFLFQKFSKNKIVDDKLTTNKNIN